jgi:hypothetical protein
MSRDTAVPGARSAVGGAGRFLWRWSGSLPPPPHVGGTAASSHRTPPTTSSSASCAASVVHYFPYPGVEPGLAQLPWVAASPTTTGIVGHLFYYDN